MAKTARELTPREWRELTAEEFVREVKARELAESKKAFVETTSARLEKALRELKAEFPGAQLTPEIVFTAVRSYIDVALARLEARIKATPDPMRAGFNQQTKRIEDFYVHLESQELRLRARIDSLREEVFGPEENG